MKLYTDQSFVDSIISAINEKKLILFLGAGFSKLSGLPLWNDLANLLIDSCISDIDIELDYADKNVITRDKDAKMLITIAYYLFLEKDKLDKFNKLLYAFLSKYDKDEITTLRRKKLIQLVIDSGATILTTNSDSILHECFANNNFIYFKLADIYRFKVNNQRQLLHLHGYKGDMNTMVYTVKQYLERYADAKVKRVIKQIFNSDYTILFIGYGLSEMQMLDFLIDDNDTKKNRFVLDGFFSNEEADFIAKQHYYNSFDLQLIGYCRDQNNYLELVNAFDFLIREAKSKSRMKPETFLQADSLLNTKPNKSLIHQFNNILMELSFAKRKVILKGLVNSSYRNEWIKYIYKEDYFGDFNIDNMIKSGNKKNSSKDDFDCFMLIVLHDIYLKDKNASIFNIVRDFLLKLLYLPQIKLSFKNGSYLSGVISRLVFSDYRLINKKEIFEFFLENLNNVNNNKDWITWISHDTKELRKAYKTYRVKINKAILRNFSSDEYRIYEFENYVDVFGYDLSENFPNDVYKQLKVEFGRIFSNAYYSFSDVGSLISYLSNIKSRNDFKSVILRWYVFTLNLIESEKLEKLFDKYILSKSKVETKLAIVLLNNNFDKLKERFFALGINPFNDWDKFSDLYQMIYLRWGEMDLNEKNQIKNHINIMRIKNISDFYNVSCKMDLLDLIGNMKDEIDSKQLSISIKNQFTDKENDIYLQFPEPILRNRSSWSETYTITDDEDFKKELYSMKIAEFLVVISNDLNDSQQHTVTSIYVDYFDKNDFVDWVSNNNYSNVELIKYKNYRLVIQYLLGSTKQISFKLISKVMGKMESLCEESDKFSRTISVFLSDFYFKYIKRVKKDKNEFNDIFEYCLELYENHDYKWKLENDYKSKISNTSFLSMESFQIISILVISAYNTSNKKIITILQSKLDEGKNTAYVKGIIIANIRYLWSIDKQWVEDKIVFLFDNQVYKQNISIVAYNQSLFVDVGLIDLLCDNKLFEKIINSVDLNENKWAFIHNLLVHINQYGNSDMVLNLIAKTRNNFGGINSYFSELTKIQDLSKLEETVNYVCQKLSLNFQSSEKTSGLLLKNLLLIYPKLLNTTYLWDFIMNIIQNHGTYYTKEIKSAIEIANIENNRKIDFIEKYVISLTDHFYRLKEVSELIKIANWDDFKYRKQQIINKIGDINPEFWKLHSV